MSKKELTGIEQALLEILKNLSAGFEGSGALVTIGRAYFDFLIKHSSKKADLGKCEETKAGGLTIPAPLLCEAVASVEQPKTEAAPKTDSKPKGDK